MSAFSPQRLSRQPFGRGQVDISNPISRGLKAAFVPGAGGFLRDVVTGNRFNTSSGTFQTSANKIGQSVKNAARNTQSAPDPGARYANSSYTYVLLVDMVDTGATYAGLYCRSTSGASAASLQNSPAGAGKFDVYHSGSPAYTTTAGTGFVSYLLTGGLCVMAVCYDDSDRSIRFYLNGALIESGTCSASPTLGDGRLVLFGERGETNTYGMQGACSGLMLWDRALRDGEAKAITATLLSPFQVVAPAQRRLLFDTPVSGTDTLINPGVGALALTGYSPTIAQTANQAFTLGAGTLALTGYAPSVAQSSAAAISPNAGAITVSGFAPAISQPKNITSGAGSLTITGFAPTIAQVTTTSINPGAGAITVTGYAPTLARTANISISPLTGAITLAGFVPTVFRQSPALVTPGYGSITFTGYSPTIYQGLPNLYPVFNRTILMRADPNDRQAVKTATQVYNVDSSTKFQLYVIRPDETEFTSFPVLGTTDLATVDEGIFTAGKYSVYTFVIGDLSLPGEYIMRHAYQDTLGQTISQVHAFTVTNTASNTQYISRVSPQSFASTPGASSVVVQTAITITGFRPVFSGLTIMRASLTDPTACMTVRPIYNIGDPNSVEILLTRPDNSTVALYPSFGTTPLVTVDQGTFAAYQYSVYNFSNLDITMAGKYRMRHVYVDANGSIVSSDSSFTVI